MTLQTPTGWAVMTLDELQAPERGAITDGPFGSNLTSAHYTATGPRVVRLQNIGDGVFVDAKAHISEEHFQSLRKHEVRAGDLLVASLGETLPRVCLAPESLGPAIVKADCIRVRPNPEIIDRRYLAYWMQAPSLRKWATERVHGVGRPRLGLKTLRTMPVPVPGLAEQLRIVEILEDHLSRLDAASAACSMALKRCNALVAARIVEVLDRLEGEVVSLGSISTSQRNGVFVSRATAVPHGVPILRIGAVRPRRLDVTDLRYSAMSEDRLADEDALALAGDLLVTRYNGNPSFVGCCAAVPAGLGPLTFPDKLIRVRLNPDKALPGFVTTVLSVGEARAQVQERVKTTAGQAGIAGRDLKTVRLKLPELDDQAAALTAVHDLESAVNRLRVGIEDGLRRGAAMRRSLLGAAFSGHLTASPSEDMTKELAGA